MSLLPSTIRLIEQGLVGQALEEIGRLTGGASSPAIEVVRLELLAATEPNRSLIENARSLLQHRDLEPEHRARCLVVIGDGNFRLGREAAARQSFVDALALADVLDKGTSCHVRLAWFGALASWVGPSAAIAEGSRTRRAVHSAGDSGAAARFHLVLAEVAAKQGLLQRARHHLTVADSLLQSFPNYLLRTEYELRTGAICALSSDPSGAAKSARDAIDLARKIAARTLEVVGRTNLGHALIALERYEEARIELDAALSACRSGGAAELGVLDGLLQLALAEGADAECERLARELVSKSAVIEDGHSYYGLWHQLTRVKWLYRTGDTKGGVALALEALPRIERMADRNLLERMSLLAADGLGRIRRAREGAARLAATVAANPDPPLEMLAEAERVAGRLSAPADAAAARDHFARAARILRAVGHLSAADEVDRDARETLPKRPPDAAAERRPPDPRPPAAPLVERLALLLDLAALPPLLAADTLALIADTGAASGAALVETSPEGRPKRLEAFGAQLPARDSPRLVHLPAGSSRGRTYEVVALPRDAPAARATLLAVERLVQAAAAIGDWREQARERAALWPDPTPEQQLGLISAAESMQDLIKTARRIAGANMTVLITGETGTGKELFARAIHQASARRQRLFFPFNCTAVPRDMLDSQLFGHRRGAFTGAHADFPGVIRSTAGGTLFLDEIGELGPEVQPKLLRFLESGEILPLGEARPQTIDVRIVAATNADLDRLVADGRFRQDLYYRLNAVHLRVPPLRERREEIPLLVDHFLDRYAHEMQKPPLRVSDDALEYLVLYRWPGNVRQLANELRRVVAMAEPGAVLMPEHLAPEIFASRRTLPASERPLAATEMIVRIDQPLSAAVEHVERAFILRTMRETGGNVQETARRLGVSRRSLYEKRVRFGFQ